MRSVVSISLLLLASAAALGQNQIQWRTDPQAAAREAQATQRPLLVWVRAADRDRDSRIEREQQLALTDPRVVILMGNFVPLRLSRSANRDVLPQFGLPSEANQMMSFVAPDGTVLGNLGAAGAAQADSLAQKMRLALRQYAGQVYETQFKPVLQRTAAEQPRDAVKNALQWVGNIPHEAADKDVIELLDKGELEPPIRRLAFETLARLSTKPALDKLFALVDEKNKAAEDALARVTPAGAESIMERLKDPEKFTYGQLKAAATAVGIRNLKSAQFFERAKDKPRQDEIDRVDQAVRAAAERWKRENQ